MTIHPKLTLCDFPGKTDLEGWSSFSPFVVKVDRALCLAGLPYERHHVNMLKLKELNPLGQLPVLIIGDEKVADSTRILQRIEGMLPGSLTASLDPRGVAEAWLWEEFADTSLYPYVLTTRWADERGWPVPRDSFFKTVPALLRPIVAPMVRRATLKKLIERDFLRGGLEACYARLQNVLDHLDARAPEDGFWLGARASVADVSLFAQLHSLRLPLIPFQVEAVKKRKRLWRYLDRVDAATSALTPGQTRPKHPQAATGQ